MATISPVVDVASFFSLSIFSSSSSSCRLVKVFFLVRSFVRRACMHARQRRACCFAIAFSHSVDSEMRRHCSDFFPLLLPPTARMLLVDFLTTSMCMCIDGKRTYHQYKDTGHYSSKMNNSRSCLKEERNDHGHVYSRGILIERTDGVFSTNLSEDLLCCLFDGIIRNLSSYPIFWRRAHCLIDFYWLIIFVCSLALDRRVEINEI